MCVCVCVYVYIYKLRTKSFVIDIANTTWYEEPKAHNNKLSKVT